MKAGVVDMNLLEAGEDSLMVGYCQALPKHETFTQHTRNKYFRYLP